MDRGNLFCVSCDFVFSSEMKILETDRKQTFGKKTKEINV